MDLEQKIDQSRLVYFWYFLRVLFIMKSGRFFICIFALKLPNKQSMQFEGFQMHRLQKVDSQSLPSPPPMWHEYLPFCFDASNGGSHHKLH